MKQKITGKNTTRPVAATKGSSRPRMGDRGKDMMTPREIAHTSGVGLLAVYAFLREGMLRSVRVDKLLHPPPRVPAMAESC